ncbi:transcriptional regulator with XRE-family HTH domain [Catenulispora sp. EB89]|uniref:helix-turn-helix domain-containing protein n=1 Tax=Catenulispora sp. EB89 TaxID=3156257 RepID=UPI0035172F55
MATKLSARQWPHNCFAGSWQESVKSTPTTRAIILQAWTDPLPDPDNLRQDLENRQWGNIMGRSEQPLERDGSPSREFGFWLRDLRNTSGLTYNQLARRSRYSISTLQEAASGRRLPTLSVVAAFVVACDGDEASWRSYWAQLKRLEDYAPSAIQPQDVLPPWIRFAPNADPDTASVLVADDWYLESLEVALSLDGAVPETVEHRIAVAVKDGVRELVTSISVPRITHDQLSPHGLEAELLHGGVLTQQQHPHESYFRYVILLPRPLRVGERHRYTMRLRVPPGQPMAPRYVQVPHRRSDHFKLTVRFDSSRLPRIVWRMAGVPTAVLTDRDPNSERLTPDRFGEVSAEFHALRLGRAYGVSWRQ